VETDSTHTMMVLFFVWDRQYSRNGYIDSYKHSYLWCCS